MKKLQITVLLICAMMYITGCTKTCKIEGCKNEIYKEGLCQKHYYINQGADAVEGVVNGLMELIQ